MENKEILLQILENTKQLNTRLDNIEKTYDKRFESIEKRLDNFEQHLDYIEKDHGERLTKIENIVTRMEKEHGEKLQVLFDYFVDQDEKHKDINLKIDNLEEKSNNHDTRIFALEFYKEEKLASN